MMAEITVADFWDAFLRRWRLVCLAGMAAVMAVLVVGRPFHSSTRAEIYVDVGMLGDSPAVPLVQLLGDLRSDGTFRAAIESDTAVGPIDRLRRMVRYRQNPGNNQIIIELETGNEEEAGRLAGFLSNRVLAATQGPIRRARQVQEKYTNAIRFLDAEIARHADMIEGRKPSPPGLKDRYALLDRYINLMIKANEVAALIDSAGKSNREGHVVHRSFTTRSWNQRLLVLLFPVVLAFVAAGTGVVVLAEIVSRSRWKRERLAGNATGRSS